MSTSFAQRVSIPDHVMYRELEGEAVVLNLDSERYFGLDEVGTRFWVLVNDSDSIQSAYEALREEFDVAEDELREDLDALIETLLERGLIEVSSG